MRGALRAAVTKSCSLHATRHAWKVSRPARLKTLVSHRHYPGRSDEAEDLAGVETRLLDGGDIGIHVNNAGAGLSGSSIEQSTEDVARVLALNTTAVLRLASAVALRLAQAGHRAIINIGSVVGLAHEFLRRELKLGQRKS
jgi:NAD(P)-dependent dehydrogenase (short-subunit alcohol dehydrogenase family)